MLRNRADAEFGPGAGEDEIARAEAAIGPLVGEYRRFLVEFGWVTVGHHEILGLGAATTPRNDLVRTTLRERSYGRIPHLIPVENIGTGDYYCVQQLPTALSESPVILAPLDPNESEYVEDRAGFAHWLIETINSLDQSSKHDS
jgi:hypothetical protein